MRLVRFTAPHGASYLFPGQSSGDLLFGEVTPRIIKLTGVDGGVRESVGRSQQAIGSVSAEWWLLPNKTGQTIKDMKQAVAAMLGWGQGVLLVMPDDSTSTQRNLRWARAEINNIQMSENVTNVPHKMQRVQANFQVADPAWYGCEYNAYDESYHENGWWFFDNGHKFDETGLVFGGSRVNTGINTSASLNVYNAGNHVTRPVLRFKPVSGSMTDLIVSRIYNGLLRESFAYRPTVATTERLVINCETHQVIHEQSAGDIDAFVSFQRLYGFGFLELEPGLNVLEITQTAGSVTVDVEFADAWY